MARPIFARYVPGTPTLSKAADEALRYLGTVRNYSPATIDGYQRSFDQFLAFLHSRNLPDDLHQFSGDNVQGFADWLTGQRAKASTVVIRLTALSSLAQTMMKLKDGRGNPYLTTNPARTFEWPTIDQPDTKFLLPEELQRFLAVERPHRESIARDLFVDTGLRVSELVRANVGDVIEADGKVSLAVTVKGRGRRQRKLHVPLSEPMVRALRQYLAERQPERGDEPLLVNREDQRWQRTGLGALMSRIGQEAGITRFRVSPHKLRHTANVVARLAGIEPHTRSRLLNHSSPQSLQRYEHLLPNELHEARTVQQAALGRYLGKKIEANGTARTETTASGVELAEPVPEPEWCW